MTGWVSSNSTQDLSSLAENCIGVDTGSMSATNTISVPPKFGAPGSVSESSQSIAPRDPVVSIPIPAQAPTISPGDDGKPQASKQQGYHPAAPAWGRKPAGL